MDDPAFGRVPRAAARNPTRKRVPGRTREYVWESDAAHPLTWVPGRYTLEGKLVSFEHGLGEVSCPERDKVVHFFAHPHEAYR